MRNKGAADGRKGQVSEAQAYAIFQQESLSRAIVPCPSLQNQNHAQTHHGQNQQPVEIHQRDLLQLEFNKRKVKPDPVEFAGGSAPCPKAVPKIDDPPEDQRRQQTDPFFEG